MKIPSILDKIARKSGAWLQGHNFRATELWPARTSFEACVNKEHARIQAEITKSISSLPLDILKLPYIENGEFTSYGAFVFYDVINTNIFDLPSHSYYTVFNSHRSTFGVRISRLSGTVLHAIREAVSNTYATYPSNCKWAEALIRVPEISLMSFYANVDAKSYGNRLLKNLLMLTSYHTEKFERYDADGSYLKQLEDNLLFCLCDGFHVPSYNVYSSMVSSLPTRVSSRMPALKLKLKACSSGDYRYIPEAS